MQAPLDTLETLCLRTYQREMFDRSLRGNVIVAMDTGSGKTHVYGRVLIQRNCLMVYHSALLRLREELDKDTGKLSWFLAPTVALCEQQCSQIKANIPSAYTKLLLGSDDIEHWSEQYIWDRALQNVQIVVSTFAVLADALMHGFVRISQISLLVFDEAHHCSRGHPANTIMKNFYHPHKEKYGADQVPRVLGLTASPILHSNIEELSVIETNLDSVTVTPRIAREEMMKYVHRPELVILEFGVLQPGIEMIFSKSLTKLKSLCDKAMGPLIYIPGPVSRWSLPNARQVHEEHRQAFQFFRKAAHIFEELGSWAADFFIAKSINALSSHLESVQDFSADREAQARLYSLLNQDDLRHEPHKDDLLDSAISSKAHTLLQFLAARGQKKCSSIVFVQQRVIASALCTLLSSHPSTKDKFVCATFVGLANAQTRKHGMIELLDLKVQREMLGEFRIEKTNLIVATEALEEGIDISACNLVVSFSVPTSLKSFIQRRGRARKQHSCFAILFPKGSRGDKLKEWENLEKQLIQTYQQDRQYISQVREIEVEEETVPGELTSSCAIITPKDAPGHLYHFCQSLPSRSYIVLAPQFAYVETNENFQARHLSCLITATVELPICLPQSLWHFKSRSAWRTEKAARRDAAFQAYCALRSAGLLNENLLPFSHDIEEDENEDKGGIQPLSAIVQARSLWRPWQKAAEASRSFTQYHLQIRLADASSNGAEDLCMMMTVPMAIPSIPPLNLQWNDLTTFKVEFGACEKTVSSSDESLDLRRKAMRLLMQAHHSRSNIESESNAIAIISPFKDDQALSVWLNDFQGAQPAAKAYLTDSIPQGFIRSEKLFNRPHLFQSWNEPRIEGGDDVGLDCSPLSKRRDFTKKQMLSNIETVGQSLKALSLNDCTIDRLPFPYARFGMFIPTILQHVERFLIADQLRRKIFSRNNNCSLASVTTALTAPSADWILNYEEFEFFGDAILKYILSFYLYFQHPLWPEGYLSARRTRLISNQNLAQAATSLGLDEFIMIDNMKGKSWSFPYLENQSSGSHETRALPMKLLADVVEALIGAAYLEKGMQGARECMHIFIPEMAEMLPIESLPESQNLKRAQRHVAEAEAVIGYSFKNKAVLLESLTHGSCQSTVQSASWQRLEFLGDAVLDMVVVSFLASVRSTNRMTPAQMTRIKAVLVNSQMLGFLCIHSGYDELKNEIVHRDFEVSIDGNSHKRLLWQLMRFDSKELAQAISDTTARYDDLCPEILTLLNKGSSYPWILLARFDPPKVFSDMIESIFGAIYVDAGERIECCQTFARRIGLQRYMERLVAGEVDLTHPKTALSRAAKESKIEYTLEKEISSATMQVFHSCCITSDGVQLSHVEGCLSKDEAVLTAALKATDQLQTVRTESAAI